MLHLFFFLKRNGHNCVPLETNVMYFFCSTSRRIFFNEFCPTWNAFSLERSNAADSFTNKSLQCLLKRAIYSDNVEYFLCFTEATLMGLLNDLTIVEITSDAIDSGMSSSLLSLIARIYTMLVKYFCSIGTK